MSEAEARLEPKRYILVWTDMWRLARAPFAPRVVFGEQRNRPTFWLPWAILSLLLVALTLWDRPIVERVAMIGLEEQARGAATKALAAATLLSMLWQPVQLLVRSAAIAGVMYLSLAMLGATVRFRSMMTAAIFASAVAVLKDLASSIVLHLRGIDTLTSIGGMRVSFGLDLLVPSGVELAHVPMAILSGIGPFEVWGLLIVFMALRSIEYVPEKRALTTVVALFAIELVYSAAMVVVFP